MIAKFITTPFQKFVKIEGLGGYMLFGATALAIIWANSPWASSYEAIWQYKIGIESDTFGLSKPIMLWINDALMTAFFFLIGLEIKRELLIGELNTPRKASLPIFAALGGVSAPVIIYILLNNSPEASAGWGIPMATDIAFSLALLNLLGRRVPLGLKVFLTAFAIVDDIGAVLVIAVFYSEEIKYGLILLALIPLLVLIILGSKRIYAHYIWISLGAAIWLLFLKAGIHPTIAGILVAFTVPIKRKVLLEDYTQKLENIASELKKCEPDQGLVLNSKQIAFIDDLEDWADKVQSPLQHLEHKLHSWVAYMVMPLFALANAGIVFDFGSGVDSGIIIAIAASLFVGNLVGIPLLTIIGVKLKLTELPEGMGIKHLFGIALLAGVGFTMSIFISNLAFIDNMILANSAKIGILGGSILSGLSGYILLRFASKK